MGRKAKTLKTLIKIGTGAVPTFILAFSVAFLASSNFTPVEESSAETIAATVKNTGYYVNIAAASEVTMDINATVTGAVGVAHDTVLTKTNSKSGYKLYISMNGSSNKLYKGGDSTSSDFISPVTGTFGAPSALVNGTWGYAVPGAGGFDAVYVASDGAGSDGSFGGAVNARAKFAAMPAKGSEQLLQTTNSANEAGTALDIYYGVRADMSTPAGSYYNTIAYTAFAEASSAVAGEASISPAQVLTTGGGTLTFTTSLYSNYSFQNSDVSIMIGSAACPITAVSTSTGVLVAKCTIPELAKGNYNVSLSVAKFGKEYSLVAALTVSPTFWDMTYMQEMTSVACSAVTTPVATALDSTKIDTDGSHAGDTAYVPQRLLYDIRDGESYRVRKLADGNCWMTENLRLNLSTTTTLTPETTSIATDWTPNKSTVSTPDGVWGTGGVWNVGNDLTMQEIDTAHSYDGRRATTVETADGELQKIGNYYNWYAATAGTGDHTVVNADASGSICPKGWYLPWPANNFQRLVTTVYNIGTHEENKAMSFPLSFVASGAYKWSDGTLEPAGLTNISATGRYWGSNARSNNDDNYWTARSLHIFMNGTGISPYSYHVRAYGFSIRCIARA